jgi:radical SAM superfamily enzyme YgiQ (UPF0313 family)
MKVTFIKPNIGRMEHSLYVDEGRMEPLQLGVIAGLTPPDVECVLYDDRLEAIPYDEPTDLVAITVETYTARRAYEIAAEFRARGVPVIIDDARHGRLQPVYRAQAGVPQPGGSQPRRDLFEGKGYLPVTLMQFSRGCRFACTFCAVSVFFNRTQFVRQTREILAEIENQDRRFVFFVDDNFLSDHAAAKVFLRELIPMRIKWVSQASLDMTDDPELMDLLEASGCLGNVIGFESLDPRNLRTMKKAPNLTHRHWDRYREQCEILRRHHLQTWAAFTLGHDWDTVESIRATLDFAMEKKFAFAAFNILVPYPNTALYDRLKRENRLLWDGKWWLHPEYRFNHATFIPKHMTPDELTEACWYCRSRWNTPRSIFKRMWDFKTHLYSPARLAVYLGYNPLYAKETFKKQGMLFGLFRDSVDARNAPVTTKPGEARPTVGRLLAH